MGILRCGVSKIVCASWGRWWLQILLDFQHPLKGKLSEEGKRGGEMKEEGFGKTASIGF